MNKGIGKVIVIASCTLAKASEQQAGVYRIRRAPVQGKYQWSCFEGCQGDKATTLACRPEHLAVAGILFKGMQATKVDGHPLVAFRA